MADRDDSELRASTEVTDRRTAPTLQDPRGTKPRSEPSGIFTIPDPADRYELGKVLGEGGMGRVVEAFDRQLDRKVALKFLTYPDPKILEMFQTEARSQARVQHDHVLEVYDIGELEGRPFISMRHLPGKNLEERREELSQENLIRLLAQAAEGLHAAHRNGLIHHDVKPSNILVEENADGDLVAYISDFGVASRIEDSSGIAGTPSYLAPERVTKNASIDRRSDIYSLGVTMYQMLTGKVPFKAKNPLALFEDITEKEPPPLRSHLPSLPVELEAIVMRCIAKDPDQRYPSARAVAEDLRRFLDGEIVEAYAAGLSYRLTRFALRNKILVAMAGIALVALLISSIAVSIFAFRAETARQHAEQRRGQAEDLIGFMVGDLQGKLKELGRLDVLDDVGDKALQYFGAVPEQEITEKELLWRSQMLYQIGEVRVRQGKFSEAEAPMEESLALAQRLVDLAPDDPERLFALAQSHYWVGFVYWKQDAFDEALEPFEKYLVVAKRLSSIGPSRLDWLMEVAHAHNNLSAVCRRRNDPERALEHLAQFGKIIETGLKAEPTNPEWISLQANNKGKVARLLRIMGQNEKAIETHREELAILQALYQQTPEDLTRLRPLAICHSALGNMLFNKFQLIQARNHQEAGRKLLAQLIQVDPSNTDLKFNLLKFDLLAGKIALVSGDRSTGRQLWQRIRQEADAILRKDPTLKHWRSLSGESQFYLALEAAKNEPSQAIELAQLALETLHPTRDQLLSPITVTKCHLLLGSLHRNEEEALSHLVTAEAIISERAKDSRETEPLALWAESLFRLGRLEEIDDLLTQLQTSSFFLFNLHELCLRTELGCGEMDSVDILPQRPAN